MGITDGSCWRIIGDWCGTGLHSCHLTSLSIGLSFRLDVQPTIQILNWLNLWRVVELKRIKNSNTFLHRQTDWLDDIDFLLINGLRCFLTCIMYMVITKILYCLVYYGLRTPSMVFFLKQLYRTLFLAHVLSLCLPSP